MKRKVYEKSYSTQNIVLTFLFTVICFLLVCLPLSAQGTAAQPEEFWISPGADIALYSPVSVSYGGGITIAYGSGTSIGVKVSWLIDQGGWVNVMEFEFLFRLYFSGSSANSGLFIQLEGGPAIYFGNEENISFPARIGIPAIGLALGWRFLLGNTFFIEPSVRAGYPYIAGAGLSAGIRF